MSVLTRVILPLTKCARQNEFASPNKFHINKRWSTTEAGWTTKTGALLEEPEVMQFGLFKVIMTVIPGLYIGASISKTCAAFLEENDIFVPDDDDDDD